MQTKTREALNVILNSEDYEIFEALELLQERIEVDTELTEEEIHICLERSAKCKANGYKGISLDSLKMKLRNRRK